MDEEQMDNYVTACHEAGHAVAAVMRGGGEVKSISIKPMATYLGHTSYRGKPCDTAFVTFAGPWAEARAQWPYPTMDVDDVDDEGCTFEDYFDVAWFQNRAGDLEVYSRVRAADLALYGEHAELLHLREAFWHKELEDLWSVMLQVADRLLAGDHPAHAEVMAMVNAHCSRVSP